MKKKLALDLDGVVFDSENLYRVYTEMYDVDVKKAIILLIIQREPFKKDIIGMKMNIVCFIITIQKLY